jgi:hypothetical protein
LYTVDPRNRNSNFGCEFLAGPGLRPGPVLLTEFIGRAVGHLSFRLGSGDPARLPSAVLRLLILRGRAPRSAPTPGRLGGQRPTGRQSHGSRAVSPAARRPSGPTCTRAVSSPGTRAVSHTARRPSVPRCTRTVSPPGARAVSHKAHGPSVLQPEAVSSPAHGPSVPGAHGPSEQAKLFLWPPGPRAGPGRSVPLGSRAISFK